MQRNTHHHHYCHSNLHLNTMVRPIALALAAVCICSGAVRAEEEAEEVLVGPTSTAEITVVDGPTECEDAEKVKEGDLVKAHYKFFWGGEIEDDTYERGLTFNFPIGIGHVIPDLDANLVGLCKGSKSILTIPSEDEEGQPGPEIRFDFGIVDVTELPPTPENIFNLIDRDGDHKLSIKEQKAYPSFLMTAEGMPAGLMESVDEDMDGYIDWVEFQGPKGYEEKAKELMKRMAEMMKEKEEKGELDEFVEAFESMGGSGDQLPNKEEL